MFDVSCNGRWPSRGYQPYKGTHEEELEDIQIRMEEPHHLPSFDDLVLAQSDSLTPVQIRRLSNVLGPPPWTFESMSAWVHRPPGSYKLQDGNKAVLQNPDPPVRPPPETPRRRLSSRASPCTPPHNEVVTLSDTNRIMNDLLLSPVKRLRKSHDQVLDRFAATKENISAEDVTIHILMTKRKRFDITIPIELSDENSMDDLHAKIQYSSSTAIVSE